MLASIYLKDLCEEDPFILATRRDSVTRVHPVVAG